jgi:hypothetical protein
MHARSHHPRSRDRPHADNAHARTGLHGHVHIHIGSAACVVIGARERARQWRCLA